MAPEVAKSKGFSRKSDIWSLGCTVIEMAVGGNPWGIENFDNNLQAFIIIAESNKTPNIPKFLSAECHDFLNLCLKRDKD